MTDAQPLVSEAVMFSATCVARIGELITQVEKLTAENAALRQDHLDTLKRHKTYLDAIGVIGVECLKAEHAPGASVPVVNYARWSALCTAVIEAP